jgi:hypothetical protein
MSAWYSLLTAGTASEESVAAVRGSNTLPGALRGLSPLAKFVPTSVSRGQRGCAPTAVFSVF